MFVETKGNRPILLKINDFCLIGACLGAVDGNLSFSGGGVWLQSYFKIVPENSMPKMKNE